MISFFRYYDPLRIIALLVLLICIKLVVFITVPQYIPFIQIDLMNIGQRLAEGNVMYRDVWDTCEPLSAGFYYLVNVLFGKSYLVLQVFGVIFIAIQALMINMISNKNNLYGERTSLPGLIYVVCSSFFIDAYYASPLMLGQTLIIPILYWSFKNLKLNTQEDDIFISAIFIGLAALFHLGFSVFFVWLLLYLLLFIKPPLRLYGVVLIGFIAPILLAYLYYLFRGLENPVYQYLQIWLSKSLSYKTLSLRSMLLVAFPSCIMLILGLFSTYTYNRYVNFQYNVIKLNTLYLMLVFVLISLLPSLQPSNLVLLLPPLAYFATNFFHFRKSMWFSELPFIVLLVGILWISNMAFHDDWLKKSKIETSKLLADVRKHKAAYTNQKVLILGNDKTASLYALPCTPYLNWRFAKNVFAKQAGFDKMSTLYYWLEKDRPTIIIDQENMVPELMAAMPSMYVWYEKQGFENIYLLKKAQ